MTTAFPGGLDDFNNPQSSDTLDSPPHADQHANANDAIEALEAKVGADSSAVTSSLDYRVTQLEGESVTPGGSDGDIQYNNGGSLGGSSSFYYDDANERVGIGTDSPSSILDLSSTSPKLSISDSNGTVGGSMNAMIHYKDSSGSVQGQVGYGTGVGFMIVKNLDGPMQVGTGSTDALYLRTSDVNRITVDGAGMVGIGDDTPSYKLDVNGPIRSVNTMYANHGISVPFVYASRTTNQTIAQTSYVVLTSTSETDANGWWNGSRFQPTIAGTYHISFIAGLSSSTALSGNTNYRWQCFAYKNTTLTLAANVYSYGYPTCGNAGLITLNGSTDYVEIKGYGYMNKTNYVNHFKFAAFRVG